MSADDMSGRFTDENRMDYWTCWYHIKSNELAMRCDSANTAGEIGGSAAYCLYTSLFKRYRAWHMLATRFFEM